MARNLETLLEQRTLEDLPADLIKQFSAFIREEQRRKSPLSRSGTLVEEKMRKWREWVDAEDWPAPIVKSSVPRPPPAGRKRGEEAVSPTLRSAVGRAKQKEREVAKAGLEVTDDGVFMMDAVDAIPPLSLSQAQPPPSRAPSGLVMSPQEGAQKVAGGWKVAPTAPR
jgi:inhibitor of Bruton tyrosine kinase